MSCTDSSLTMRRCVIESNTSLSGGEFGGAAGGLKIGGDTVFILENCLVHSNRSDLGDQIITGPDEVPAIFQSCTIVSNEGGIVWDDLPPVFRNCILWGSPSIFELAQGAEGEPDVSNTCIQGGHEGIGNIMDDPMFFDEVGNDYHLQFESPCLDTADTEGPSDDLDGKSRPFDVPGVGREGDNTFDMGAYEFQIVLPTPTPKSADIDQSGKVDSTDLLILIGLWGQTPEM